MDRERKTLVRYRNNPADASTLPSDWVLALYEDGEDGIWVGTANGGAARISATQTPFRRYGGADFGGDDGQSFIFTAYESRDGSVWAGGKGAIYRIDPQTGHYRRTSLPEDSEVRAIVQDRAGLLWVGMLDGSLFRLNPATGASTSYPHGAHASRGCANNEVRAFLIDHLGQLWLGAADTLCRYGQATVQFMAYKAQSPGLNEIDAIAEDSDGALWLGSSHFGLYRFDPATGTFAAFHHSDAAGSLSNDVVNAVLVDHSGTVWAGSIADRRFPPVYLGPAVRRRGAEVCLPGLHRAGYLRLQDLFRGLLATAGRQTRGPPGNARTRRTAGCMLVPAEQGRAGNRGRTARPNRVAFEQAGSSR